MWNVFDIFTSALGNWLRYCSLKSGAGILISWEPKTLTNNLWSMETQSRQTKRCWTSAKVQHEKLIATVNQLKMWLSGTGQENYWYRNGFLTMSEEMRWHIKDRSTTLSFFFQDKLTDKSLHTLLLWATSRCSGDRMKRFGSVNVSLGDCVSVWHWLLVQDVTQLHSWEWFDKPSSLSAGEAALWLLLVFISKAVCTPAWTMA